MKKKMKTDARPTLTNKTTKPTVVASAPEQKPVAPTVDTVKDEILVSSEKNKNMKIELPKKENKSGLKPKFIYIRKRPHSVKNATEFTQFPRKGKPVACMAYYCTLFDGKMMVTYQFSSCHKRDKWNPSKARDYAYKRLVSNPLAFQSNHNNFDDALNQLFDKIATTTVVVNDKEHKQNTVTHTIKKYIRNCRFEIPSPKIRSFVRGENVKVKHNLFDLPLKANFVE